MKYNEQLDKKGKRQLLKKKKSVKIELRKQ